MYRFAKLVSVVAVMFFLQAHVAPAQTGNLKRVTDPSYVCMVNNTVMDKPQIPVTVGSTTYHGCCEMCVKTLNADWKSRFATDPVSGGMVDKAKAVIGAKGDGGVLYFESEESLQAYQKGKRAVR